MSEEEVIKLRTRLQLAEDSNKILVQKLKNKDKTTSNNPIIV